MTGGDVKEIFEEIIDDNVSDDLFVALLEGADGELRDERDWYILRAKGSVSRAGSDTYETAHLLPVDFDRVRDKEDAVRSEGFVYKPIDFDQQEEYKDLHGYYYLSYDPATERWRIYFTGATTVAETVYVLYQKRGTVLTTDNYEDTALVWPGQRGQYLAWLMAKRVSGGVDGDEINFRMSPEQARTASELKDAMNRLDSRIRFRAMGGKTGFRRGSPRLGDGRIDPDSP